jgi:hypothetical protein
MITANSLLQLVVVALLKEFSAPVVSNLLSIFGFWQVETEGPHGMKPVVSLHLHDDQRDVVVLRRLSLPL